MPSAEIGLYDVYWSATTLVEVERALHTRILSEHPARAERIQRLLAAMRAAFPAATVIEDCELVSRLTNDPKDRHVLAVAVQSGVSTIVTRNLRDFPAGVLGPYGITARPPEQFLQGLFRKHLLVVLDLLVTQGAALRNPRTLDALLDTLAQYTPEFARLVRAYAAG